MQPCDVSVVKELSLKANHNSKRLHAHKTQVVKELSLKANHNQDEDIAGLMAL